MYKVGGSLDYDAVCYVKRKADDELYQSLQKGDFCYVLNSRQMGKSSLLVKTKYQLQNINYKCASVDITSLGSENITAEQWYKGIITQLWRSFNLLGQINLKQWYQEQANLAPIQLLNLFITDILFKEFRSQKIIIFVDEIDSILSLPFSIDDFFAFIRFCYNQRAIDPEYHRITFAIFGVATPSDLIKDRKRTPFNIGKSIELTGFTLAEIEPLIKGLNIKNAQEVMKEILNWTNGQPFLTQKICQLLIEVTKENLKDNLMILPINEAFWVESIVKTKIIDKWQYQDEPEHLRTIRDRIYRNENKAGRLLEIYQHILEYGLIESDNSREQIELILSGLVININGKLIVKNKIYQEIFNLDWIKNQLNKLRPYSQTLQAYVESDYQDQSRLLRGNALKEAQNWAETKSLSQLDYQYLRASEECDRKEVQQALEAERIKEVEARLLEERKTAKLQKLVIKIVSLALVFSISLGSIAIWQYHQAKISEVKALISSAQGRYASDQKLDGLIDAIKAKKIIKKLPNIDPKIQENANFALAEGIYTTVEKNRFNGHLAFISKIIFSQDGQYIFTLSNDHTVKIWTKTGQLLNTLKNDNFGEAIALSPDHKLLVTSTFSGQVQIWQVNLLENEATITLKNRFQAHDLQIFDMAFSQNGQILATGSEDHQVKLWQLNGTLISTLKEHQGAIFDLEFSPNGKILATTGEDKTIKLWTLKGEILRTLTGHQETIKKLSFSPDSQLIVTGSKDNYLKLWQVDGSGVKDLIKEESSIESVSFSPDGDRIATITWGNSLKIWNQKGQLLDLIKDGKNPLWRVNFSPDGKILASGSYNGEVKLWQLDHPLLTRFKAHNDSVRGLAFSPNNKILASSSWDNTAKLWTLKGDLLVNLLGHQNAVLSINFSPDGNTIITGSSDQNLKLWNQKGEELKTIKGSESSINGVEYSPNGQIIASVDGKMLKIWKKDGTLIKNIVAHDREINDLDFSPDGEKIITGSGDKTLKMWQLNGKLLHTFKGNQQSIWGVKWSSNNQFIVSGSVDDTVKIWSVKQLEKEPINLTQHRHNVDKIAISPNSKIIASPSWDRTIKLWDNQGHEIKTLVGHTDQVRRVVFSPNGELLASGSDDYTIIIWKLNQLINLDELTYACNWVRDYLHYNQDIETQERRLCD